MDKTIGNNHVHQSERGKKNVEEHSTQERSETFTTKQVDKIWLNMIDFS